MSESSKQFQIELGRLMRRSMEESDLTIGDAIAALEMEKFYLYEIMRAAKEQQEGEPE